MIQHVGPYSLILYQRIDDRDMADGVTQLAKDRTGLNRKGHPGHMPFSILNIVIASSAFERSIMQVDPTKRRRFIGLSKW